jgi:hypothetical protein
MFIDIFKLELIKSNRIVNFKVKSFHYLNPELNMMFDSEYPSLVALYKRDKDIYKRINVLVIENLKKFFNSQPISDELKETNVVLILNEALPNNIDLTLEYLNKIQHEIINELGIYLKLSPL